MQERPISYRFYATLLDSFDYYLKSESDVAFQEFIDKLNRKPFVSEAAAKGTAFNALIDGILFGTINMGYLERDKKSNFIFGHENAVYAFKESLVKEIVSQVNGSMAQIFTKAILPTRKGNVELYGYADYLRYNKTTDLKTTGSYTFPKFLNGWQSKVYPYCFNQNGIYCDTFEYLITDFSNVYKEEYIYKPERDDLELQRFCEQLIDFVEQHRGLITSTDPKVLKMFGQLAEAY